MDRLIILGTSYAVSHPDHANTHLLVQQGTRLILVDCASEPLTRLQKLGFQCEDLTDIVLTHFHPDHVSGFGLLLMDLWLLGRTHPLKVYGLADVIERAQKMMDLYRWENWPNFYPVEFVPIDAVEGAELFTSAGLRLSACPTRHMIPTIALRMEYLLQKFTLVYSCDTEPSAEIAHFAAGANVLLHDSTGASFGHSSAAQAGEIACQAGVQTLYLIHYAPEAEPELLGEARQTFGGNVIVAQDQMEIQVNP